MPGSRVLDLYAGTGALGIEALSRGAAHATFVDRDPRAVAVIRMNLATCGLAHEATVLREDVRRALEGLAARGEAFDLVFFDPPYLSGEWARCLAVLPAVLAPEGVVVREADAREVGGPAEGGEAAAGGGTSGRAVPPLVEKDRREYGGTALAFYGRAGFDEGGGK